MQYDRPKPASSLQPCYGASFLHRHSKLSNFYRHSGRRSAAVSLPEQRRKRVGRVAALCKGARPFPRNVRRELGHAAAGVVREALQRRPLLLQVRAGRAQEAAEAGPLPRRQQLLPRRRYGRAAAGAAAGSRRAEERRRRGPVVLARPDRARHGPNGHRGNVFACLLQHGLKALSEAFLAEAAVERRDAQARLKKR